MSNFVTCLLCGSTKLFPLKKYQKFYLVKCKSCGFVFCKKIPSFKELVEEYHTAYTRRDDISKITLGRYKEILEYFEKFRVNNTILDVGAGNGHFAKAAKEYGWEAYGTEFDERAVEICRSKGINMHEGKLDAGNYKPEMFDIITSFEVLEHINNPLEEIANFNKILRTKGLVYITTPNYNSISHSILKNKWTIFNYPEHLCYYSAKTIKKLFLKSGFKPLSIRTTGIDITRIKNSIGLAPNKDSTFTTEGIRRKTERSFGALIKRMINYSLNLIKKGDKIKGEFIKIRGI